MLICVIFLKTFRAGFSTFLLFFSFVTVFAPSNDAMKAYKGPKDENFILNHMGEWLFHSNTAKCVKRVRNVWVKNISGCELYWKILTESFPEALVNSQYSMKTKWGNNWQMNNLIIKYQIIKYWIFKYRIIKYLIISYQIIKYWIF